MVSPLRSPWKTGQRFFRSTWPLSGEPSSGRDRYQILTKASPEDRIRAVFCLAAGNRLPAVGTESLWKYHRYLLTRLAFPFQASNCEEVEPLVFDRAITVAGLINPDEIAAEKSTGILCKAWLAGHEIRPPLALLKPEDNGVNSRLIDDYWHWFWNFR